MFIFTQLPIIYIVDFQIILCRWLVITQEPPLPSIELLAKPEEKLAGIRFDPALFTPSRLDYATSLQLQHMATGEKQTIALPEDSEGIRYIRFVFLFVFIFIVEMPINLLCQQHNPTLYFRLGIFVSIHHNPTLYFRQR